MIKRKVKSEETETIIEMDVQILIERSRTVHYENVRCKCWFIKSNFQKCSALLLMMKSRTSAKHESSDHYRDEGP